MFAPRKDGLSNGRIIEFFHHDACTEWGGPQQQNSFALLHPVTESNAHGLYVVFHSAGHDLYSAIGCTFAKNNHDIYRTPDDMFGLYLDCRAHAEQDFWWGGINARGEGDPTRRNALQPVERRVMDTIAWVVKNYPVDQNRIYGSGNSMGGSGALGIGMARGDVFAAIKANVAAGIEHMMDRCFGAKEPLPDMPVCIDYSAQNDAWSQGHDKLYRAAREHRFALFGYWAPFGHANDDNVMLAQNDLIHSLDWLAIRKNQAYPAFTNADCDDPNPWENDMASTAAGQVNAFFRWTNILDTQDDFQMRLLLATPDTLKTVFTIPETAVADVTMHRLQAFQILPRQTVHWNYGDQAGMCIADTDGRITINHLKITDEILKLTK